MKNGKNDMMKKVHWSIPVGLLLLLLAITIRSMGLEIGDFSSGVLSGLTISLIIFGLVQLGKHREVAE